MANFKRTLNTNGKFKMLAIADGNKFIDYETGEFVDVPDIIGKCMGEQPFDLSVTQKSETDITPENSEG